MAGKQKLIFGVLLSESSATAYTTVAEPSLRQSGFLLCRIVFLICKADEALAFRNTCIINALVKNYCT